MNQIPMFTERRSQATLFVLDPIKKGDAITNRNGRRYVVDKVDSNVDGAVYVCASLDEGTKGATAIVLEREVAVREARQ